MKTQHVSEPMLGESWRLSSSVALRPEPFGALAYNFHNRKLTFLKRPELVSVVRGLGEHGDVRSVLVAEGIPAVQWPAYLGALRSLAETEVIARVTAPDLSADGAESGALR